MTVEKKRKKKGEGERERGEEKGEKDGRRREAENLLVLGIP